jgi:spore germination cell wall hydrolase CwlJ-like protein
MWHHPLKYLPDPHRWVLASGFGASLLGAAWYIGALASPTPADNVWLHRHATGGPAPFSAPAGPPAPAVPPQTFEQLSPQQAQAANAALPASTLPSPPARPFELAGASPTDRTRALTCLTMAVYYEAGDQGDRGEAAVAQVVLNRLRHPLFPKTVCGVVFEGSALPTGCQFTFACDGSLGRRPSQAGWRRAAEIATQALDGHVAKEVGEATHYHTVWVVPYWRASVVKLTQVGAHIFYRWPGGLGLPAAFRGRYAGGEGPPPAISGFDAGLQPAQAARLDEAAPPPLTAEAASAPEPIGPPPRPAQIALLSPAPPAPLAAAIAPPDERPKGYFGRDGGAQHLPVPARW